MKPKELLSSLGKGDEQKFIDLLTKPAEKKPFLISLSAQGNLDSLGNQTLSSAVEGTTSIITIVPEGTMVEANQIVCELDSSQLREKAKQQEITVTQADSAEAQAKEKLEITKTQNESDIAAAKLKLQLADLDLKKFTEGEFPQQRKELEGSCALAEEELTRAVENYDFTKQQVKKGYRTLNEMEANRIAKEQARLKLQGAQEKLKVLRDYDYFRKIAELEANAKELVRELERVKLKAASAETQAQKDYEAQKLTCEVEHEKLNRLNKQIDACTLRAPKAGQVVYANMQASNFSRSSGETIEQGATVRERQAIINLPDISQMKVDCRIHESLIGNIKQGLPARIRISSEPDRVFQGVISSVSSVPMSGRWPNMDLREYETEIKLTDSPDIIKTLRPGLTAQVEIIVDSRDNVLQIPVQAVLAIADKQIAFVLTKDGEVTRELEVGQSNQSHVEVKKGVEEGELVIMNARSQFANEIAALEAEWSAEKAKRSAEQHVLPTSPGPGLSPSSDNPSSGGPGHDGQMAQSPGGGGPGDGGGGGRGGPNGGGGRSFDPGAIFAQLDTNGDGKLTTDEAGERMRDRFPEIDKDKDGTVSKEEFVSAPRPNNGGGRGGGGGGGNRGPGPAASPAG